jgi:hypothetical protein
MPRSKKTKVIDAKTGRAQDIDTEYIETKEGDLAISYSVESGKRGQPLMWMELDPLWEEDEE